MDVNMNLSIRQEDYPDKMTWWKVLKTYMLKMTGQWNVKIRYDIDDCGDFDQVFLAYAQYLLAVNTVGAPHIELVPLLNENFSPLLNEDGTSLFSENPPMVYYP